MNTTHTPVQPPLSTAVQRTDFPLSILHRWAPLLLSFVICAFYLGTTQALPLLGKDEPRYVEVAREMFLRNDWVTPTLGNHTWFEKPALLYWLIIVSFKAFGVSEWAARLGPALCAVITVALIFKAALHVETMEPQARNNVCGLALWSSLAMASNVGLIAFAHAATFDIVLTATITLAMVSFFMAELERNERQRTKFLSGLWVGIGLSLLAKGLVGLILPGGIILLYLIMRRDWRRLGSLQVGWGLPLALAVAAIWYGPVIARHGGTFINEFFVQHHFARYLSNKYKHVQPAYYYLPIIALFALPWTAFVFGSLCESKVSSWRDDDAVSKLRVFAIAWLLVPIAFFSLSWSKLPGYVLPALPGAILLAGIGITKYVRGERGHGYARITGLLLIVLGAAIAIYLVRTNFIGSLSIIALVSPLLVAGVSATSTHHRTLNVGFIVAALSISTTLLTTYVGVPISENKSVRTLIRRADLQGYGTATVWQMNTIERTAEFYAAGRLLYDAKGEPKEFENPDQIAHSLSPQQSTLVLLPLPQGRQLMQSPLLQSTFIGDNGDVTLMHVRRRRGTPTTNTDRRSNAGN